MPVVKVNLFKLVVCIELDNLDIVQGPGPKPLKVVRLPLSSLTCAAPECLPAGGVGGGDPDE